MDIHPTAVVDAQAEIAENVVIKPYTIIGPNVHIGSGTVIGPHVVIDGWTTIGQCNRIFPFASIGHSPQDITYREEPTQVIIGDHNIIRENVTIHRGTPRGGGITRIGSHNFIMAYAHIAHDCVIGDFVIMANCATLGGHVRIDDHAVVGGLAAIHQFVRVGTHAYVGGLSPVTQDIPPYTLASNERAKLYGLNLVGLRRNDFSMAAINALKKCYKIIFRSNLILKEAIDQVREQVELLPEVETLLSFLDFNSRRGITR
jgi:UDP-N-acetylglucosamine acyltransferase